MHRVTSSLALGVLALALAACSVTVTGTFDPPAEAVAATADPQAIAAGSLAAGSSDWYEVTVSSSVASQGDLIYLEAEADPFDAQDPGDELRLTAYTSSGGTIATSESPAGFASGSTAPTSASAVGTSAVSVALNCLGSCVILPAQAGTYYIKLTNIAAGALDYRVYAYSETEQDTGEPNDSPSSAVLLSDFDSGAIETIGDEDYYDVNATGQLLFDSTSALDLRADVYFGTRRLDTLLPGESYAVEAGDTVVVYALNGQAGAPAASTYSLDIQ